MVAMSKWVLLPEGARGAHSGTTGSSGSSISRAVDSSPVQISTLNVLSILANSFTSLNEYFPVGKTRRLMGVVPRCSPLR